MKPNPYLYNHLRNQRSPKIVEENSDGMTYIGDCTPDCTGYGDKKWLIKLVATDKESGLQRVFYANGSTNYNQRWTDRYNLPYLATMPFDDSIEDTERADIPMGTLATADGTPIVTADSSFIVLSTN